MSEKFLTVEDADFFLRAELADANRRLALLQEELNALNELREFHNAEINRHHRNHHEALMLLHEAHSSDALRDHDEDLHDRVGHHLNTHGRPSDVPEQHPEGRDDGV